VLSRLPTLVSLLTALAPALACADTQVSTDQVTSAAIEQSITAPMAAAGGNRSTIIQTGSSQTALTDQYKVGNSALINQSGSNDSSVIRQFGMGGSASSIQQGSGLNVIITQTGNAPHVTVTQSGPGR
jgi:hypothetical protein